MSNLELSESDAVEAIKTMPCPVCSAVAMRIEYRLTAKPIGSFSLAGQGMKVNASNEPWAVCDSCGAEGRGHR